jgi:hypothetical protein
MSSDKAREFLEHLEEWMRRYEAAKELAPKIQREIANAQLTVKTWDYLKVRAPNEISQAVEQSMAREITELKQRLPLIPRYDNMAPFAITTSSTSNSTVAVEVMLQVYVAQPQPNPEGASLVRAYEKLHQDQNQFGEAESRIKSVLPSPSELLALFQAAEKSHRMAVAGVDDKSHAAGDVRNFLYKFKGELFDKARRHKGDNMTWPIMAARFVPDVSSVQHLRLLEQERIHNEIYDDLSKVTKLQRDMEQALFSATWFRAVDHVIVVCGCILDRGTPP